MPDDNQLAQFAETNFRNVRTKFGIKTDDRRRHMYVIGKTGMGKTTMLENMAITDIQSGKGVGIVDPHGEFAEKMLDFIPADRINDVIYFNPADVDYPIAFNVMEKVDPLHKHLVASGMIGVFKKIWADSWGPRLEYVLRNAILALLDYPESTLLGIMRILVDKAFRKRVMNQIKDPVVKSFWVDEYSKYPDRFQAEAIAPIQNKVGQFLSTALIRNVVGQTKSSVDMSDIINNKKILIINLAKGRIGEDSSALMGAMLITKIQLAAMERVSIPEEERKDFYLYVDEFQNFATEAFANILSEARKYRLDLILAHQYITQMEEVVSDAVFGNVGTLVSFRIGAADAELLEKEFEPTFMMNDLVNLTKYNIYLKLMIDGVASHAFSATTLPPLSTAAFQGHRDKIIKVSRERYTKSRVEIEEKIARWTGMGGDEARETTEVSRREERGEEKRFVRPEGVTPYKEKPTPPTKAPYSEKEFHRPFEKAFKKVFEEKKDIEAPKPTEAPKERETEAQKAPEIPRERKEPRKPAEGEAQGKPEEKDVPKPPPIRKSEKQMKPGEVVEFK